MKIEYQYIPTMSIEEFADKHDLTMVVTERANPEEVHKRFYACFKGALITAGLSGDILEGYGSSINEAIKNYAANISNRIMVVNVNTDDRREFDVPRLYYKGDEFIDKSPFLPESLMGKTSL